MSNHSKHTNLVRRKNDNYAPNEISILGTNCTNIGNLVQQISPKLTNYKVAYIDASHASNVASNLYSNYVFHHEGNLQIQTKKEINPYQQKLDFASYDLVFINGNHYQGTKQILILDDEKEASVLKRINQLTDIQFLIKLNKSSNIFKFLIDKYPSIRYLPVYEMDDVQQISSHINKIISNHIPKVNGLVLMGGKSTRMGTNKANITYLQKEQKEVAKQLLVESGLETYYSVAHFEEKQTYQIPDTFLNLGPFGGICSAFQYNPNAAWLVLAIDLPFVSKSLIRRLIENRNPSKIATAIKGKGKEFVEPLITIYEPKAYPILLQYLAQGYSCPRKVLINNDIEIIEVDDDLIRNINTPQEFELAKKELNN